MLFVVLIALVGVALSDKTVGDVKKCHQEATAVCLTQCKEENSDVAESSWTSIQTCFDAKKSAMEQCASGLSDSSPCFAMRGPKWGKHGGNSSEEHHGGPHGPNGQHHEGPKGRHGGNSSEEHQGGPHGRHNEGPKGGPHGRHFNQTEDEHHGGPMGKLPKAAEVPLRCLFKCQMKSGKTCAEGCTGSPPKPSSGDMEKFHSCGKSAHESFDKCLKEKFPTA